MCNLNHDKLRETRETWTRCTANLEGYSDTKPAIQATDKGCYEVRNCLACGSTLMRKVW